MLHWLRTFLPPLNKNQIYVLRLLAWVATCHIMLLLVLFLYRNHAHVIHISKSKILSAANIVYVPWIKRFNQKLTPGALARAGSLQALLPKKHEVTTRFIEMVPAVEKKQAPIVPNVPKAQPKAPQPKINKPKVTKPTVAKPKPKPQPKKATPQKPVVKPKPKSSVPPVTKPNTAKSTVPNPTVEPAKSLQQKAQIEMKKGTQHIGQTGAGVAVGSGVSSANFDKPIYIGREEKDEFEFNSAMQNDILKVWKAPIGFSWDTPCEVRVSIDNNGKVQSCTIEKSSGIIVVDVSIRAALKDAVFSSPQVHGKELVLALEG